MKILHISSEKGWRGGERQILLLIKALECRGISSTLMCKKNSELEKLCIKSNIPHFVAPFQNSFDIQTSLLIKQIAQNGKFDILHLHTPKAHTTSVIAALLGLNIPMVLTKRTSFKIKKNFLTILNITTTQ